MDDLSIPGVIANISRKASPYTCVPWHIPQYVPKPEGTHALYEVSAGVRSTRNEDGGIVLDIDQGQIFRLNPVAALILELLRKGLPETEIAKDIAHQYTISEEIAVADVREFLKSLEQHKLVRAPQGDKVS